MSVIECEACGATPASVAELESEDRPDFIAIACVHCGTPIVACSLCGVADGMMSTWHHWPAARPVLAVGWQRQVPGSERAAPG